MSADCRIYPLNRKDSTECGSVSRLCRLSSTCYVYNLQLNDPLVLTIYEYLLTAESVRIVVIGDRIFLRSQTLTVRSSLPETTLSPNANTAEVTCLKMNGNQMNR